MDIFLNLLIFKVKMTVCVYIYMSLLCTVLKFISAKEIACINLSGYVSWLWLMCLNRLTTEFHGVESLRNHYAVCTLCAAEVKPSIGIAMTIQMVL
jgi:hypothetical protein